ncbi:putative lipoprotein [Cystobacter fuscus DSM 2262]|uniref:Lipoprotein n=1 Tax=Cystobacter fuscus (strain ATCC 25194 / DSM 2262 / NBRC 100088 / M29) TaxID=1242864 RepID=S9PNL3_CYSF2|nr:hypothetical protein [Cystobacter fuscus]EPX64047.1 putative lipoprotein [Cystobacter fuscus DSM 2262]
MRLSVRPRLGAALLALAVGGTGCEGCRARRAEVPVDAADASAEAPRSASRRVGVKVPLPTGWSAQPEEDGSLRFGPPHHPVLRVDLRTGEGDALPSGEALTALLGRAFEGFVRSDEQLEAGEDFVLVRVKLAPRLADGGVGEPHPAFFGARRVERDLFLCASLPGVSEDEVREAASSCQAIHLQPPPR